MALQPCRECEREVSTEAGLCPACGTQRPTVPEEVRRSHRGSGRSVRVSDIDMPFWSMVWFMVRASLAAIPALIILAGVAWFVTLMLAGAMATMG